MTTKHYHVDVMNGSTLHKRIITPLKREAYRAQREAILKYGQWRFCSVTVSGPFYAPCEEEERTP